MCGRYYLSSRLFALIDHKERYNEAEISSEQHENKQICPGETAPVYFAVSERLKCHFMHWGFKTKTNKAMIINARIETMNEKPLFALCAERGRCILPVSGYYEWRKGDGQKFKISLNSGEDFYLAGLCRFFDGEWEFVVVTQPPTKELSRIHNRMPVILQNKDAAIAWLKGACEWNSGLSLSVVAEGDEQIQMGI